MAGAVCTLSTNCEQLLSAARDNFLPVEVPPLSVDFSLRLWVDNSDRAQPPWPQPYVRGLDHLVFAGFDSGSSMLADLRARRVIGRFSAAMASDTQYWERTIFPMLLSVLAGEVGFVELHAACIARDRGGLVLIGPSRSGKSTLAMALIAAGFRLLSDDRTFCWVKQNKLLAWGMPRPLKLRREAATWFEEFRDREPMEIQNGERVFHYEPDRRFGGEPRSECEPRALVFLERQQSSEFHVTRMRRNDARARIETDLMAEAPEAVQKQAGAIDQLLALPCWRLRYGGQPQAIAEQIVKSFIDNSVCQSPGTT
ncbi:MAG TPA: hypothetical protein VIW68_12840 [Candidatus Sulfotelmatobacter sp.]